MKGQFIVPLIIIILLAFISADYVYTRYQESIGNGENTVYFLQQGVYSNEDAIQNIAASYITIQENHKFYTYLGMTLEKSNAEKVKKLYEKKNIPVYIKPQTVSNVEFLNALSQYDILLKSTDDGEEITNILETILSTYEEILKVE